MKNLVFWEDNKEILRSIGVALLIMGLFAIFYFLFIGLTSPGHIDLQNEGYTGHPRDDF